MSTTSAFRKTRLLAGASRGLGYAMSVGSVCRTHSPQLHAG
jgi:hypothetical protein